MRRARADAGAEWGRRWDAWLLAEDRRLAELAPAADVAVAITGVTGGQLLPALRRWAADQTPGVLDPLEVPGAASYLEGQNTCFPVSREEINTNPNLKP